jgi:CHAD domain-containing protein
MDRISPAADAVMPSPRGTASKSVARAGPAAQSSRAHHFPRLTPPMACDQAFRVIARHYLADLTANHEATRNGDPDALHQMRIALTHLRAAILFFSPMVADRQRKKIRQELKWLNSHLGAVRDIDVAIERLKKANKAQPQAFPEYRSWSEEGAEKHRHLAQVLSSVRYRRLIESISAWIQNGRWSIEGGKRLEERDSPIAAYGAAKLARWQQKLLNKSRKLQKMSAEKRHRLRLLNKKLTYSIDFFEDLFSDTAFSKLQAGLKYLRKAQRSLGQLNDNANANLLATALQVDHAHAPLRFLGPKREKRLLQTAAAAYRKLDALRA